MDHYRILVKRGDRRRAHLYPFSVRQAIPVFPLPLQAGDREPAVRLGDMLKQIYDECRYNFRIDYGKPPIPALNTDDAQWAAEILRAAKAN